MAARVGDPTAHGGIVTGPGVPTVVIGGQFAAVVGDLHTCPMVTVLVPHVGGPIVGPGIVTVLVGGRPASVMGDVATCVGAPSTVLMGAPTVMIGG